MPPASVVTVSRKKEIENDLARLIPDRGKQKGLGKGRDTIEILCDDRDLFRLGAGEPWDVGS